MCKNKFINFGEILKLLYFFKVNAKEIHINYSTYLVMPKFLPLGVNHNENHDVEFLFFHDHKFFLNNHRMEIGIQLVVVIKILKLKSFLKCSGN